MKKNKLTSEPIEAIKEKKLAVTSSGELIEQAEMNEALEQKRETFNHAYSLPVGEKYRYYKMKIPTTDQWAVGWVYDRPLPKNAIAISDKKAFEMVFGVNLTNEGTNKLQWEKVSPTKAGSVIVRGQHNLDNLNLPNPNDEDKFKELLNNHKIHHT